MVLPLRFEIYRHSFYPKTFIFTKVLLLLLSIDSVLLAFCKITFRLNGCLLLGCVLKSCLLLVISAKNLDMVLVLKHLLELLGNDSFFPDEVFELASVLCSKDLFVHLGLVLLLPLAAKLVTPRAVNVRLLIQVLKILTSVFVATLMLC